MRLMVLDGNSIVNRAFYGVRLLSNSSGMFTNAVYGFLMILQKLLAEDSPDAICVSFDLKAPTFRHDMYEGYKAQRKGMPEELAMQMPVLKDVLDAMNISRYEFAGYEADDLIGTISRKCADSGWECVIVTGDRDSLQLVGENVKVKLVTTRGAKTETTLYDTTQFINTYGFTPEKLVDLKALMGDVSDNIPGVAGIGEKTASDLIKRFGTIENIYVNLNELDVKKSVRDKLRVGEETARMSYELAKINREVPIDFCLETNLRKEFNEEKLYALFKALEFTKLIEKFGLKEHKRVCENVLEEHEWQHTIAVNDVLKLCTQAEKVFFMCPKTLDAVAIVVDDNYICITHGCSGDYNEFLRVFFSDKVSKVTHDVKTLMVALLEENIKPEGFIFDTSLAAYLQSPTENSYTVRETAERLLQISIAEQSAYDTPGAFDKIDGAEEAKVALEETVCVVKALYERLDKEILGLGMEKLYYNVELPLCRVLADMEYTGFTVDRQALASYGEMLSQGISKAENSIYELAGMQFNINSTKQLGEVLFEKMGLPIIKKTKRGYSTDIDVLEKLRPYSLIIDEIITYRQLAKLKSTYVDGLAKYIGDDGRIHSRFNMTVTATGRLSSAEPNLQNIPVKTELGGEIRRMFIPERPEWVLVDADYSQIELRILAHISGDKNMCEAFMRGEDIHRITASQVFGVPPEEVTSIQRSRAKAVNFGIVYGISKFSLAQDIGVPVYEAGEYMDRYLEKYHGVRDYMKEIVEQAKKDGYVSSLFGRRRSLPELQSSNYNIRSFGERVALNMPIQGTAADIMKLAMIRAYERLKNEKLEARLILQVHDELIAEAPLYEEEQVKRILEEEMENAVELTVPLPAKAHSGKNWFDAK